MATARETLNQTLGGAVDQRPALELEDPLAASLESEFTGNDSGVVERAGRGASALTNLPFLIVAVIISIIGLVVFQTLTSQRAAGQAVFVERASSLLMLSQRVAKDARGAALASPEAFKSLRESSDQFATAMEALDTKKENLGRNTKNR